MPHPNVNLQDSFLNQVRKDNVEVAIRLLDGARLTGIVRGFDNFTVILQVKGEQHLIYKHAMAHIVSSQPVRTAPAAPAHHKREEADANAPHHNRKPRKPGGSETSSSKKKEEKFNTLDFSSIQLPEGDKPTPEKQGE